jgi:tripartite-type tricarboxylate transporter receptor subunit TctC
LAGDRAGASAFLPNAGTPRGTALGVSGTVPAAVPGEETSMRRVGEPCGGRRADRARRNAIASAGVSTKACCAAAILVLIATAGTARAADVYPSRPVRMVAPFAAGGTIDVMARLLAEKLGAALGQNIVVDNRPGANGLIGTDMVAKSARNGYTMLLMTGSHTSNVPIYRKLPYDAVRDFAPVTQIARSYGLILSMHAGVPANSIKELVAHARANPSRLRYASSGIGNLTHYTAELLNAMAKVDIVHVPYKGSGPALTDVIGRQLEMTWVSTVFVQPFIKSGRVKGIVLSGATRTPIFPDIPTMQEEGFAGFDLSGWYGLWFPAGTPRERVMAMNGAIARIVAEPDMKRRLDELGLVAVASSPEAFAKFQDADIALMARIARQAKIEPQ